MRVTARLPGALALGAPPLPSPSPLLVFRTFCLPKPKSLTHPSRTQPLSPLSPSSSLLGAALASGEQLVAHSSLRLGEGGGGLGRASPLSAPRPEALGAGWETAATRRSPSRSPHASAAAVSTRAPRLRRLTAAYGLADSSLCSAPLARPATPTRPPRPAHSAGPHSSASPQLSANPAPRFRRVGPARPARPTPPTAQAPPALPPGFRRLRGGQGRRGPCGSHSRPRLPT